MTEPKQERAITIPNDETIARYTTTYNCVQRNYPLQACVESLLGFCDEVAIVDAGSEDGTIELISKLAKKDSRIKWSVEPVDFTHPRWAIHMDGFLKAKSRKLCSASYCWQTDTDEVVPPEDYAVIRKLPEAFSTFIQERPVIYLPMVEFWGSFDRIRADFFSWKPRFSLNHPEITHGIPIQFSARDPFGNEYPIPFESDSCNYIWRDTKESVRMLIPSNVKSIEMSLEDYEKHFEDALNKLPCVLHVSWFNLKRKIEHYREFWPKFHASMYCLPDPDSADHNVMFQKPWSQVTDLDIQEKAKELDLLGPRTFHKKMNPGEKGRTIGYSRRIPNSLLEWAATQR